MPTLSLMTVVRVLKDADRFKPVPAFLLQGLEAIFSKAVRGEREGVEVSDQPASATD